MNDQPTTTDSTAEQGPARAGGPRRATRPRRAVIATAAAAAMITGLVLPSALAPAGAEAPTANATATSTGSTLDPALVARLDAALDEGFAASEMPGVTVGLWIPGQGEWVVTRGVSNLETDEPMDRANQAKIGSITKTLVGTTALQIIGEGQVGLTLDDTIDRWYPDFPEASNITVRMLMNMSSGVASPGQAQIDRICADPYSTITPDEYIAIGAATPREPFAPGEGYQYSGVNTFLLGRILEKTTGTDLTTLLDQRLLGPLGMTRSRFAPDGQLAAPLTHGYTDFCRPDRPPLTDATDWYLHEAWAAGAMLSTIDDLHTWGLALGAGVGLTPAMLAARVTDTKVIAEIDNTTVEYGLGVGLQRDPSTGCLFSLYHTGAEPGYGSAVIYYPSTGSVFALLGNGDGGTGEKSFAVSAALAPALREIATTAPTESCETPPPAPTVAVTPVVGEPAFTG